MTILLGSTTVMPIAAAKKKQTLMPLLTVVFVISYGLMTMLIVEQGETIQSQRNLIQILQGDSRDLWTMRGKAASDKLAREHHAQAPSTQTPSTRGQAPSVQTPSTQAVPQQHHSQNRTGKTAKPQTQVPPMPASDLGDQRRALITL